MREHTFVATLINIRASTLNVFNIMIGRSRKYIIYSFRNEIDHLPTDYGGG